MVANLAAMRALVRKDLHDEDSANYVWSDAVLDRHITRAVNEYSHHVPLEKKDTLTTTAGSRDLSVASLTSLIDIERVEWPTGEFPPRFVGFSKWGSTITLDVVAAPNSVQNVNVYWNKLHTLDGSGSDIDAAHDDIVATGAAGYAALDRDVYAINRINTGGDDVWGRYETFGKARLIEFRRQLRDIGRKGQLRQRLTYTTDAPAVFEQGRVKY